MVLIVCSIKAARERATGVFPQCFDDSFPLDSKGKLRSSVGSPRAGGEVVRELISLRRERCWGVIYISLRKGAPLPKEATQLHPAAGGHLWGAGIPHWCLPIFLQLLQSCLRGAHGAHLEIMHSCHLVLVNAGVSRIGRYRPSRFLHPKFHREVGVTG